MDQGLLRPRLVLMLILGTKILCCSSSLFEEDGVLVRKQSDARIISAIWQLVVLITPPTQPPVERWIEQLEETIRKTELSKASATRHIWEKRLETIKLHLHEEPKRDGGGRVKRGAFNFIGTGASYLFGLVTGDQMEQVAKVVEGNSLRATTLQHNQNEMLSLMNDTRTIQKQLARRIHLVSKLTKDALITLAGTQAKGIKLVRLDIQITAAIAELEATIRAYKESKSTFHRIEMQVDRRELTEDLLSKDKLVEVLTAVRKAGFMPLPVHWYYSYAAVSPIYDSGERIAYSIALPMITIEEYITFDMQYLPIVIDASHIRLIVGAPVVAVNTRARTSFIPDSCVGTQPLVCHPVMERTEWTCEAALATGRDPANCQVAIRRSQSASATVSPPRFGERTVAIAPHSAVLQAKVRCPSQAPVSMSMTKPTLVQLPPTCTVEGPGWLLQSVLIKQTRVALKIVQPPLQLPAINISWPTTVMPNVMKQLDLVPEVRVPALSLVGIKAVPPPVVPQRYVDFMSILGILLLLAIAMVLLLWCIRRRKWRCAKKPIPVPRKKRERLAVEMDAQEEEVVIQGLHRQSKRRRSLPHLKVRSLPEVIISE